MLAAPAFLFLNEAAQLFGIADDRTLVRMFVAPFAQVVKKLVNVIAGLGCQLVLNPPYFFQNWIRFHISMSYQFDGCANLRDPGSDARRRSVATPGWGGLSDLHPFT